MRRAVLLLAIVAALAACKPSPPASTATPATGSQPAGAPALDVAELTATDAAREDGRRRTDLAPAHAGLPRSHREARQGRARAQLGDRTQSRRRSRTPTRSTPSARPASCAARCTASRCCIKDNIDVAGMVNSAGSLALADNRPKQRCLHRRAPARRRRGDPRQDQPERVGELPLDALDARAGARAADRRRIPTCSTAIPAARAPAPARAIAASLAAIGVGTETDGSIICPSSVNGLVGLKPTVGLVSRNGIIPISVSQDTAGPMARTVPTRRCCSARWPASTRPIRPATPPAGKSRPTTRPSSRPMR